jgi:hypothetical protein
LSPILITSSRQVSICPKVETKLLLADAAVIKVGQFLAVTLVANVNSVKPVDDYAILRCFGANIVASEGDEWKKVRKITAPAFSDVRYPSDVTCILSLIFAIQRNNRLVWDETSLIMLDLFNNVWGDQKEISVDHCVDITLQVYIYLCIAFRLT